MAIQTISCIANDSNSGLIRFHCGGNIYGILRQNVIGITFPDVFTANVTHSDGREIILTALDSITYVDSPCAFKIDGENLYVAYNSDGEEITYWFKKCMANNLYTFYRIGYRTVDRTYPSVEGVSTGAGITYINKTASDNIGPLIMSNGGAVGGNHHYPNETDEHLYLTAKTDSFSIYANGVEVPESAEGYAESILVKVKNTIYDPAIPPVNVDDTSLSTPLCEECVSYAIRKNTIEVAVSHRFVSTTTNSISDYFGMQSMFEGESHFMTPNGAYVNWQAVASSEQFTKRNYPNFNRFIEKKNTSGTYQSTYLEDFGLGNHSRLGDGWPIFHRGSNKSYHRLIGGTPYSIANKFMQWAGSYTFFHSPLYEDDGVFVYMGTIRGKDVLFINTKSAYSGSIPLPSSLLLSKLSVIENYGIKDENGNVNFQIGGCGLYIESESTGSLILQVD